MFSQSLGLGGLGVRIFFVLSGYLITDILLHYRGTLPFPQAVKLFYWRRLIRLSPAFYLALLLALLAGIGGSSAQMLGHALYFTNVQVFQAGQWYELSHLWSLAVEEQFYLLWFPLIMLAAMQRMIAILVSIIAASLAFNGIMSLAGYQLFSVLLPAAAHCLAIGGLLAYMLRHGKENSAALKLLDDWRCLACAAAVVLAAYWPPRWEGVAGSVLAPMAIVRWCRISGQDAKLIPT